MIDKLLDRIASYHVWRFILVFAVLEIIGAVYLLYLIFVVLVGKM